jgi:hypothetical protein
MHVFVSYSREDSSIVRDLVDVLTNYGIKTWVDAARLAPGTPEWDQEIRLAIADSLWVLAICSENARDSNYVAIELAIAAGLKKITFPIWAKGEIWPQSAPMSLVLSQYVDIRPPHDCVGLNELLKNQRVAIGKIHLPTVQRSSPTNWPFIQIVYGDLATVLNPFTFDTRGHFLTEIYIELLENDFPPNSYGETWALELSGTDFRAQEMIRLLALPASWAAAPMSNIYHLDPKWFLGVPDLWSARLAGKEIKESPIKVVDLRKETAIHGQDRLGVLAWRG